MAVTLLIPTALRQFTDGNAEVGVEADTVGKALEALVSQYVDLRKHLFNESGAVRSFVNLYVDGEDIRQTGGLDTSLGSGAEVMLVPSIAGGSGRADS